MPLIVLTPFRTVAQAQTYFNYAMSLSPVAYWRLGDVAPASIDDDFTGIDGSLPDADLWDSAPELTIQNNKLNYTDATAGNIADYTAYSRYEFVGDFDFQIDFDFANLIQSSTDNKNGVLLGISNTYVIRRWNSVDGNVYQFLLYNEGFGSLLANFSTVTTDTVGKLRFTRVGDTYTAFYWSGSQWEWNGDTNGISHTYAYTFDSITNSATQMDFQKGDVALNANMDNFTVSSGTYVPRFATDAIDTYEGTYNNFPTTNTPSLLVNEIDNQAVAFDGVDQYVNLPTGIASSITDEFSIVVIANTESTTEIQPISLNNDGIFAHIQLNPLNVNKNVRFYVEGLTTADFTHKVTSTPPHYLTLTAKDGGNAIGYINGVQVGTDTVTSFADLGIELGNNIGTDRSASSNFFDGTLDEIKVYNKVLTPAEIATLYQLTGLDTSVVLTLLIDHTKVPENLYDFPVLVNLDATSGITDISTQEVFNELDRQDVDDDFTGTDGDAPNPVLWNAGSYTGSHVPTSTVTEIEGNELRVSMTTPFLDGLPDVITYRIRSVFLMTGDYDIEVDINDITHTGLTQYVWLGASGKYIGARKKNGLTEWVGDNVGENRTSTFGKVRIVRVGSILSSYYKDASSIVWNIITNGATVSTADTAVDFAAYDSGSADGATVSCLFDNFKINSGTIVWPTNTNQNALKLTTVYPDTNFHDPLFVDDDFTGADGDVPDRALWDVDDSNPNIITSTSQVVSNALRVDQTHNISSITLTDINSRYSLQGDFDVEIDITAINEALSNSTYFWLMVGDRRIGFQTFNSNLYIDSRVPTTLTIARTNAFGSLRLTRVGSTYTSYYKDGNTTWSMLQQNSGLSLNDVTVVLRTYSDATSGVGHETVDWDNFKVNSGTIVWPDSVTQECKMEVDRWDQINKQAQMWVKVPFISKDYDTVMTLTANNNIEQNTTNVGWTGDAPAQDVWTEYDAVYHLSSDGADSTVNALNGTLEGGIDDTNIVDFGIGKGLSFNGIDEWIDIGLQPTFDLLATESMTVGAIINSSDVSVASRILQNRGTFPASTGGFQHRINENEINSAVVNSLGVNELASLSSIPLVNNESFHSTMVFSNNTAVLDIFHDGDIADYTPTITGDMTDVAVITARNTTIGCAWDDAGTQSQFMNGKLKEIRFAKDKKTTDWISSNHESTQDTLMSYTSLDYPLTVKSLDPIAYWRLGEAVGETVAVDEMGNYNGTYVGTPTLETPGLLVDDANTSADWGINADTVQKGISTNYVHTTSQSICALINVNDIGISSSIIKTGRHGSVWATYDIQIFVVVDEYFILYSLNNQNDGTNQVSFLSPTPLAPNETHHVVCTFDDTTKDVRIYINGAEDLVSTWNFSLWFNTYSETNIGFRRSTVSSYVPMNGIIDEVSIFDKALTQKEVTSLYERTRINRFKDYTNSLGPIAYWRLGESSGTTAVDETGTYNGTYVNAPTLGSPSLLVGDDNSAVHFDGIDQDMVNTTIVPTLTGLSTGTVTFSCSVPVGGTARVSVADTDIQFRYVIYHVDPNQVLFYFRSLDPDGVDYFIVKALFTFTADTAYHLSFVQDDVLGCKIYINGELQPYDVFLGVPGNRWWSSLPASDTLSVGSYHRPADIIYSESTIDEVSFFDYALNADEVKRLYDLSVNVAF